MNIDDEVACYDEDGEIVYNKVDMVTGLWVEVENDRLPAPKLQWVEMKTRRLNNFNVTTRVQLTC